MPSDFYSREKETMNLKEHLIKLKDFFVKFFEKISTDNAFNLAAALAYYAVFSMAPFLYILVNVLGLLFEEYKVRTAIFDSLAELIGPSGAAQLQSTLINMGIQEAGWFQNVVGLLVLLFAATTIFATIQNGLNYIFRVKVKLNYGIFSFFKTRLIAFAIIIGIAFIALISLVANGLVGLFSDVIIQSFPALATSLEALNNFVFPYVVSVLLFLIIFRYLPDASASWKDLIIGALFTGLLFAGGRYLIGFYIGQSNIATIYDAAGSLMVIFVWMYYSSLIFYIGAIFTVLIAEEYGAGINVHRNTIRFVQKELEVE